MFRVKTYKKMETGSQQKVRKLSKGLKIIVGGLAIILIVLSGIGIGGWFLQKNIPDKLKTSVYEESLGQYSLDFDKMTVSLLSGTVNLENVKLNIDTQAYLTH